MMKKILSLLAFSAIAFSLPAQAFYGVCVHPDGTPVIRFTCVYNQRYWSSPLWAYDSDAAMQPANDTCPEDTGLVFNSQGTVLENCQKDATDPEAKLVYYH